MKTKTIKIDEIVIDAGTQQRERINDEIVSEYSEAIKCGAKFPAITVFADGVNYYLADGFHRLHAHRSAEILDIEANIHDGTLRDAKLQSLSANKDHGLRRSQSDKKKAVMEMISDKVWSKWTNRDIANHVGVSHTYVNNLRNELEKAGNESGNVSTAPPKPAPALESENEKIEELQEEEQEEYDPKEDELQEAHDTINHLSDENTKLRDALATGQLPDDEIVPAEQIIIDLRKQVKILEVELDAVKSSRDIYQTENAQLKQQCRMYQNKLKKLGA